jgi:hypothetical protein
VESVGDASTLIVMLRPLTVEATDPSCGTLLGADGPPQAERAPAASNVTAWQAQVQNSRRVWNFNESTGIVTSGSFG